jgi:hypothetical protein
MGIEDFLSEIGATGKNKEKRAKKWSLEQKRKEISDKLIAWAKNLSGDGKDITRRVNGSVELYIYYGNSLLIGKVADLGNITDEETKKKCLEVAEKIAKKALDKEITEHYEKSRVKMEATRAQTKAAKNKAAAKS